MRPRVSEKWRPPLHVVVGGTVLAVLTLPLLGVAAMEELAPALGVEPAAALIVIAVAAATLVIGFLLWRLLVRPIRTLASRAEAVRAGHPVPGGLKARYGTAEMGALGQAILDMAQALQDREASIRSFTDHVTHELKAPLTAIRGAAELMEEGPEAELARTILDASSRMERELAALRAVAAARETVHRGSTQLVDVLPRVEDDVPGLEVSVAGGERPLPLAREGLRIVLTQLLRNAAEHGAGRVALRAEADPPALEVADDGPGISEGNRTRIFDPFFTTRRDGGGTGMGLAIVSALLRAHGGSIRLVPSDGGATFRIEF